MIIISQVFLIVISIFPFMYIFILSAHKVQSHHSYECKHKFFYFVSKKKLQTTSDFAQFCKIEEQTPVRGR